MTSDAKTHFGWMCTQVQGMVAEYKFHNTRKWRFDFYHHPTKTAYEFEGIGSVKSRHTSIKGYTNDCEKYNEAQKMGIKVYRFTTLNIGQLVDYLPKQTQIF